jgi:hypothetical protein
MNTHIKNNVLLFKILGLSAFIVFAVFILDSKNNFNLWDEGYVWYGAQRVMVGEVPIRDFMAFDPGRYYWSAAFMSLLHDNGFIALSAAAALFEVIGLSVGLLLIAHSTEKKSFSYLLLSAIILITWMYQVIRAYDTTVSILLIGVLTLLAQNPTNKRYFLTGLGVGLAAVFGRQHGLYGVAGSLGVMLWLLIKREECSSPIKSIIFLAKGGAFWTVGIIVGYLPIILMLLFIPNFAAVFLDGIFNGGQKGYMAFVASAIPWPWIVDFSALALGDAIRQVLVGLFYLTIFIFGSLSIVWVSWRKYKNKPIPPALVASSFLILPYAHYTTLMTGATHLSLGIFPLLIAFLVLLNLQAAKIKWTSLVILCVTSFWIMYIYHGSGYCFSNKEPCVSINVSGSDFVVDPGTARQVRLIRSLADRYAANGQSFIVAPYYSGGAYAVLERKSPMYEVFPHFARDEAFERTEIERIKVAKPAFVFIHDIYLPGKEQASRFKYTHPLIYRYIEENFDLFPGLPNYSGLPYSIHKIYIAKGNIASDTKTPDIEQNNDEFAQLKILSWGPQTTTQGVAPNLQADGHTEISIQVTGDENLIVDGTMQVLFDGKPAEATKVEPGKITASIFADQFNSLGKKEVSIRQAFTGNKFPIGMFNVEPRQ